MNKLKFTLPLFFVCLTGNLLAQQQVTQALYKHHFNIINPAVAGTQEGSFLILTSRNQWASLEGAPKTTALSVGFPHRDKRVGLGFSVVNDQFNIENQTYVAADFSYRLQMSRSTSVYLGLKAGYNAYRLNFDNQNIYGYEGAVTDTSLENYSSILPNIGAGVYLRSPKSFVSISIPRLLNTERRKRQDGQQVTATDRPHFFLSAGTAFEINEQLSIHHSFLFSAVSAAPLQFVMDATARFGKFIEAGVQYSDTYGLGGTAMMNLFDGWKVGYAYLAANSAKVNYTTHEFILKIRLKPPKLDAPASIENQSDPIK